ncbi:MAG: hypothetical protein K9H25_21940 [Rhodospirillum sp.]|nr:hypothetical protein [Rhodospirillum sp.]MCF8491710.1 hypothetical protein [Rhodospirillum sp.]
MTETERDSTDETRLARLRPAINEGDASEAIDEPETMAQLRAALREKLQPRDRGVSTEQ